MNSFKTLFVTLILFASTTSAIAGDDNRQASNSSSQQTNRPGTPPPLDPRLIINDPNYQGTNAVVIYARRQVLRHPQKK